MTLRLIEGFDYLPENPVDSLMAATGWSGLVDELRTSNNTAFNSGRSLNFVGTTNGFLANKFLRGVWQVPYVIGLRMSIPVDGEPREPLDVVYELRGINSSSTRSTQWRLSFDVFGAITLINRVNGVNTLVARTAPWAFVPGNWFYLEIKVLPSLTAGTFELRVNTVPVLSLVNVRTADGVPLLPATGQGISHLTWFLNRIIAGPSASRSWFSDDLYFLTMDGDRNFDYLGNVRARYMPVMANSTPLEWSIGGSSPQPTNWQSVLNTQINDVSFVSSDVPGAEDFYQLDPVLNVPTVFGVEVGGAYRQDDATQRFVANQIRSGTTTSTGASFATNQSYTFAYDIYELNPDTGLGWTGAELNGAQVGPKLVS